MDFAPEPVRDAFPPPPSRPAQAHTASDDANARSFHDHLDDVDEPRERPAPSQNETRDESAPVETRAQRSEDAKATETHDDTETAFLGGPIPPMAPPIAAPVAVQLAAAQLAPQAQTQRL